MITIYGASDDLIEVEGDLNEEFPYRSDDEDALLGFADGTLLRIRLDKEGMWRITPVLRGAGFRGIEQAPADDDGNYSDRATLLGAGWVLYGHSYAKAGA